MMIECNRNRSCLERRRNFMGVAAAMQDRRAKARWMIPATSPIIHLFVKAILVAFVFAGMASVLQAEELRKDNDAGSTASGWQLAFAPGGRLYPAYIANPIRPTMGIARAKFSDSDIPLAGDNRFIIRLGANVGFLRYAPTDKPNSGFQLDLEAGYIGLFDIDNSQDNIGWDGLYGVLLNWSNGDGFAVQTGIKHVSSHVGDEYAERTGRQRINYTRGEYVLGLSLAGLEYWRVYTEGGYAYDERNTQLQDPWRLEAGLEFVDPKRFWGERFGWYAAADFNWYEETDWSTDITLQAGLIVTREKQFRNIRFGVEYRNGRSVIGEFFFIDETYLSLGLWLDI